MLLHRELVVLLSLSHPEEGEGAIRFTLENRYGMLKAFNQFVDNKSDPITKYYINVYLI